MMDRLERPGSPASLTSSPDHALGTTATSPSTLPKCGGRALWLALIVALAVRSWIAYSNSASQQMGLGYMDSAATLASGYGLQVATVPSPAKYGFDQPTSAEEYMRRRESEGGRVDREHPFPRSLEGWMPATNHPAGYSVLIYGLYKIANYSGMVFILRTLQVGLDSVTCVLVAVFAAQLFNRRVAQAAAWVYALCPPTILMSTWLLPDSLHGFMTASILCAASYARKNKSGMWLVTGALLGLACHMRSEYLLLPAPLYLMMAAAKRSWWKPVPWICGATAVMLVVLLPWMMFMKSATGKFTASSTTSGAGAYGALGEDPINPWKIQLGDDWIDADARSRGLQTAWGAKANALYFRLFVDCVKAHPLAYLKIVLIHRLPLALLPPYTTSMGNPSDKFNFSKFRREEQLSRWGVVMKYPGRVFAYYWPQLLMLVYSAVMMTALVVAAVLPPREWRRSVWLLLPWAYPIVTMIFFKQIESRNVAPVLVVQSVAFAFCAARIWERRASRGRIAAAISR